VCVLAACSAEDGDFGSSVEDFGGVAKLVVVGADEGTGEPDWCRVAFDGAVEGYVSGDHDDGDAGEVDGGAHGDVEDARHLFGDTDHLAVVAALFEEILGMSLLEVVGADLRAGDVGGDGEYGHAVAMAVEETIDEVKVAGAAACSADCEGASEMGIGSGGECGGLFVAHVDPFHGAVSAKGVGKSVERVAGETIDAFDASDLQGFDD